MIKDKILAAIKAKWPAINLSKKRQELIAAKIEALVIDDESKIDAALVQFDSFNPIAEIAKADDALRNAEAKLKVATEKKPGTEDETPEAKAARLLKESTQPTESDDPTQKLLAALLESNKNISDQLEIIKGEKVAGTILSKATDKLKDIPATYWNKRVLPEKEEDLDAFVTEVTTDYTAFTKDMTDKGLSVLTVPRTAEQQNNAGKAVDPAIKAFVEKNSAALKATDTTVKANPTGMVTNS